MRREREERNEWLVKIYVRRNVSIKARKGLTSFMTFFLRFRFSFIPRASPAWLCPGHLFNFKQLTIERKRKHSLVCFTNGLLHFPSQTQSNRAMTLAARPLTHSTRRSGGLCEPRRVKLADSNIFLSVRRFGHLLNDKRGNYHDFRTNTSFPLSSRRRRRPTMPYASKEQQIVVKQHIAS